MIMITKINEFSGANFSYENEAKTCTANGEYRTENGAIAHINTNGTYTKGEASYHFFASRDAAGNVSVSGVPAEVIAEVSTEVAVIITEAEESALPKKSSK